MKLVLIKASSQYREQITNMLDEWYSSGEKIVPSAISRTDYHDFGMYLQSLEVKEAGNGLVPESTFFCLDEGRDKIVGAVNIRHYLNDALLLSGGHIGDGVRPSERRKGIATHMIGLALLACRRLGIFRVLMVCDKGNVGSARSILSNGGVLEDERIIDGKAVQRYWIDLTRNQADMCQGQQCKVYPHNSLGDYKYAVIFSKHKGGWLLSRHKARETWETQGGYIEPIESPLEAARRELYEESGARDAKLHPVCDYWASDAIGTSHGIVFLADVHELAELPQSEMREVRLFDTFPAELTYPYLMRILIAEAEKTAEQCIRNNSGEAVHSEKA